MFKVGDKVKLLAYFSYPGLKVGNIYTITAIGLQNTGSVLLYVPEGTQHVDYDGTNPGWWILERYIELYTKIGEQLLFDFMMEGI